MEEERRIWSLRVDETRERDALVALDGALAALGEKWAGPLRFKIGHKLSAMKRAEQADVGSGPGMAVGYGLPTADSRPLHAYRLSDAGFTQLQADLTARRGLEGLGSGVWPTRFVLWASEWFRRRYRGGGHRWADLVAVLGMAEDQARLRTVTAVGLRAWGRPVIAGDTAREFLGSLAREGGFPTAAIDEAGRGWAQDALKAIVAPLLGEPAAGETRARMLATMQRARLPKLSQDDEFLTLCADLALAIVALRREADGPAAAAGLPVVAWLALHRPDWRDRLPLTTGERTAETLINGLMGVEAVHGAATEVARLLVRDGERWAEAVRIVLDGAVDVGVLRQVDRAEGRLRAFAAGAMARAFPGELAMFDPPGEGETHWTARSTQRAKGIQRLPFAAAVELDLRAGDQRVAQIALAPPRRGALLVAVRDDRTDGPPTALRIVGSGSGQYRAETLYLQVPKDWRVDATAGEAVTPIGPGAGATTLWRVTGGAFVSDTAGDRYRVRCGQGGAVDNRIDLVGTSAAWAEVTGDVDLFVGPPIARTNRDEGDLWIRAIGERTWRRAPGRLPVGQYELGWRADNILLDRRRIAVLPPTATLDQTGTAQRSAYALAGFGDCAVRPTADSPVEAVEDGCRWRARPGERAVHRFDATIEWPDAPPLPVRIAHPCAASIARWDGRVLPDRTLVTPDMLGDLVAVHRGRVQLVGELADRGNRRAAEMVWDVVDELPMGSIADDIASLLLPASIDAEVRLSMHDGSSTVWPIRQFAVTLQQVSGGVVASRGVVAPGAVLVGRALADPAHEVQFGPYSLLSDANHRPAPLPEALAGDWLVYLRAGDTVLTRPLFVRGTQAAAPGTVLARAMTNPPGAALDHALQDVLDRAGQEDDDAAPALVELLALIASLHGLPPATFRVLELLSVRQKVLARLAMIAGADDRDAVLALSDALPFAWCTIPRSCWEAAQRFAFDRNLALLAQLGAAAPRYAMEAVDATRTALILREPLLSPVFAPGDTDDIRDIVQSFLNRAVDRIPHSGRNRYRPPLDARLPAYFTTFDADVIETLDAPCAAAMAVTNLWTPHANDIRHIKTIARRFPTYFASAFAAWLKECS